MIDSWYVKTRWWNYALLPLTLLFSIIVVWRRAFYRWINRGAARPKVPVVIVGNLTVGGTGKTALVIFLANFLRKRGFRPGIVSRGYGGDNRFCSEVLDHSDPMIVGDEPVLIARRTGCPMIVSRDRVAAVERLLFQHACDVVLSDDGMQHYALQRDIEIAMIDGERRFGNMWCLPAGPLREPIQRLKEVDMKVTKGHALNDEYAMEIINEKPINLLTRESTPLSDFRGKKVHVVAGIGNPNGFLNSLKNEGIEIIPHIFDNHYPYVEADLGFKDNLPVIMTEKDAVKCEAFAKSNYWYLPVSAKMSETFCNEFLKKLSDACQKVKG